METPRVARCVRKNVRPRYAHDCEDCVFVGSLDGKDLYVCSKTGEFVSRYGSGGPKYGSLGGLTPPGTDYALAAKLAARGGTPNAYVTK